MCGGSNPVLDRHIREKRSQSFRHGRMCEDGVAQDRIGQRIPLIDHAINCYRCLFSVPSFHRTCPSCRRIIRHHRLPPAVQSDIESQRAKLAAINKRMRLREERWRIIRRDGGTVVDRRACDRNFGERRRPDSWLSTRSSTWRIAQKPCLLGNRG